MIRWQDVQAIEAKLKSLIEGVSGTEPDGVPLFRIYTYTEQNEHRSRSKLPGVPK